MPDEIKEIPPAESPEQTVTPNLTLRLEFSPTIGKLFGALAKAQKGFKPVKKNSKNPFFNSKYADLAEVIDATRDALSANELAILQPPCYRRADGTVEIHTILGHSSGEWAHGILDMPVTKTDAQGVGSATTYGRRYAYSGMVHVASEADDDANAAVSKDFKNKGKEEKEESEVEFDQRTADQQCISAFQVAKIIDVCKRSGKTDSEVEAYLGLIGHKQVKDLLKAEFNDFLKWAETKGKMNGIEVAKAVLAPAKAEDRIAANKKMWATAAEFSIPEGDVKTCAYERYKVDSISKLNAAQLNELSQWIKDVAQAARES